jgi:hypothetical protein
MVRAALVSALVAGLAVALGGCFEDRYQCTTDAQCDIGVGGRCQADGYCTSYDPVCSTEFRYATHAGELTDVCYDDSTNLPNPCAGGQGPARPEGCYANVCARLPACCEVGWFDTCAQIAQEVCDVVCDTRIAITAQRSPTTELWDLRWNGSAWTVVKNSTLGAPLSWVAPVPGTVEPRLAGTTPMTLEIGETSLPVPPGRTYQKISSVSFDRNELDTIAASYQNASGQNTIELWQLSDGSVREASLPGSQLSWGDANRDGFPDAVGYSGSGNVYSFLENFEESIGSRKLLNQTAANLTGGATPGAPALRSIDWLDFNGDGELDLAVFGMSIRIHTTAEGIRDIPDHELDCSPPSKARSCEADPEPDLEQTSFVGAALPTRDAASVVFAQFPDRKLWRAGLESSTFTVNPLPFPNDTCRCIETCDDMKCPGANCTCTYDCSACVTVLAIVSRDLDGDHLLDLVAIDARLRVYTALAANNFAWSAPVAIPTTFAGTFFNANVSVSGAPLSP